MKRRQGAGGTTRFIARSKIPELARAKADEAEGLEAAEADEDEDDIVHAADTRKQSLISGGILHLFSQGFSCHGKNVSRPSVRSVRSVAVRRRL